MSDLLWVVGTSVVGLAVAGVLCQATRKLREARAGRMEYLGMWQFSSSQYIAASRERDELLGTVAALQIELDEAWREIDELQRALDTERRSRKTALRQARQAYREAALR